MDGFVSAYRRPGRDGTTVMGYYDAADLPFYWNVADRYTLFDNFFSSARVGTRLNHFYWVAGDPRPGGEQLPPEGYGDVPTIFDRLTERGVPWKFYVENLDPAANYRTHPESTVRVPLLGSPGSSTTHGSPATWSTCPSTTATSTPERSRRSRTWWRTDPARTRPPAWTRAGPRPRHDRGARQEPLLVRSAFLWTYSGGGGWYDHVPPPAVDDDGYGFRVPALMISPYSRRGEVNHTTLDYTGILRFIEDNWQVAPLGTRDASSPGSARPSTSPPRRVRPSWSAPTARHLR